MLEIADILNSMEAGDMVGQQAIMEKLGLTPGQWRGIKKILDTYIHIQSSKKIERHFGAIGNRTTIKYKISRLGEEDEKADTQATV